jgi:hypothetical protein
MTDDIVIWSSMVMAQKRPSNISEKHEILCDLLSEKYH